LSYPLPAFSAGRGAIQAGRGRFNHKGTKEIKERSQSSKIRMEKED
jgi:hypothetical protein